MIKPTRSAAIVGVTALSLLSGCSGEAEKQGERTAAPSQQEQPITLKAYAYSGALGKDDFDKYIAAPVKAKFPHITLEYVPSGNGAGINELLVAGAFPDLIMTGIRNLINFQEVDTIVDLREYVRKSKTDLSVYRKEAIEAIEGYGSTGELYALPFYVNFYMMAYNKDIFDKFSVPYPKDQMTWEEVKELAARLSRVDGGIAYRGIQPIDTVDTFGLAMGLSFVDEKSGKANVQTGEWKRAFELTKEFDSLPNNAPKDLMNAYKGADDFMKDKNVAMMPWFGSRMQTLVKANNELGFNWDVVSFPSLKESPGKTAEVDEHVFALSKTSKNPEETFKVIQYLTASEELQGSFVKLGRALPAIRNDSLMKQFGTEYPLYQSKNLQGVFKSTARQPHKANKYDDIVRGKLRAAFVEYFNGALDVNSALRKAEEEANKEIEAQMKR